MWLGLRFSYHNQIVLFYPCWFLLRRLLYAALLVFGPKFSVWQIQLIMYSSFATILFIFGYGPWKSKLIKVQHVCNELVLVAMCMLLIFTSPGFNEDLYKLFRDAIGDTVVVFIAIYVLLNLLLIVGDLCWNWIRLHCIRRKRIIDYRAQHRHSLNLINSRNRKKNKILKDALKNERAKRYEMKF